MTALAFAPGRHIGGTRCVGSDVRDGEVWTVGGVVRCGRRVLLCHRRKDRRAFPGVWDLPGGHVEQGEDDVVALAREGREELGVDVVTSVGVALVEPSAGTYLSVRLITNWRGQPHNAAPREHDEIGYFTVDEVAALELAGPYEALLAALVGPPERIDIRRLGDEALQSVGALHALSKQETYTPLLRLDPRIRFRPADLTEHWRCRVAADRVALFGASGDGALLGFVAVSMVAPRRAELNALHVRPDWHGRGLGERLQRAALDHVARQGGQELQLWVVDANARARRFYERHGWRRSEGRRVVTCGEATLPAVTYVRRL